MGFVAWLFQLEIKLSRCALMLACQVLCHNALREKSYAFETKHFWKL